MAKQEMQKLAKDTAIYGVSSILGKFLNFLLVPIYTRVLKETGDYGIVTNLYAYTALLLVILTYGMETGFFRFANKNRDEADKVFSTILTCVTFTSLIFIFVCVVFGQPIANALSYGSNPEYIRMLAIVVAMDAIGSIPFAYLRYKNRPVKFAALKMVMISTNIIFNLFFLIACPWLMKTAPALIDWFYKPDYGVGYVFVANLISTSIVTIALLPDILRVKFEFDGALLKKILRYSLPLLALGIAGIMNQTLDKIIFPAFFDDKDFAQSELGIYGACFKLSMIMMMFTQAFRYAYEPFVFAQHKDKNSKEAYADATKYYMIFSLLIFLGMVFYMDILKYLIKDTYWSGLRVVPVVLWAYIFQGLFFNLSLWYKLLDKTIYGTWFTIVGLSVTLIFNIVLVPKISYMGSAWASFACYFVMMLLSYFIGQKHMPINYDLKTMGLYTVVTLALYGLSFLVQSRYLVVNLAYRTVLLILFIILMVKRDFPLSEIPIVKKFVKPRNQDLEKKD
ncbi:lipopolysaccharide biosynthesis protein [Paludibacter sp. 221]|uniref:lipopolysaccharide biosynthesis protein n=1 Tax=Paludibacter sp. 221 TaxID=2302939 RepID=UPI0013D7179F|nr:oligosaccharide flippase family protein [Paludibacter sp. 221]NDV45784.1 lipopolysaccharide biosynthesis protein [Paludibacter sp. 221]